MGSLLSKNIYNRLCPYRGVRLRPAFLEPDKEIHNILPLNKHSS